LGNFMIFIGVYFVLCLMILPNISLLVGGTTLEIQSLISTLEMIIVLLVMMIIGAIIANKRSYFLQY
jgi:predicted transporter